MGQQQLLLLVLSTVIVGLATVAGIQAFSENQAQASQDALAQRGVTIAQDLKGAFSKPEQLGGVGSSASVTEALDLAGYSGGSPVDVPGASGGGSCTVDSVDPDASGDSDAAHLTCTSSDAPNDVYVGLDGDGDINTSIGSDSV